MGYRIAVLFFSAAHDEVPNSLNVWDEAIDLAFARKDAGLPVYQTTSRNWWHQDLVIKLGSHWDQPGLESLREEVAVLQGPELNRAQLSVSAILEKFRARDVTESDSLGSYLSLEGTEWRKAFAEAEPTFEAYSDIDEGYDANVAFFAWLKSLDQVLRDAVASGGCFVLIRPQP